MKKGNVIILIIFVLLVTAFYCFINFYPKKTSEEVLEQNETQNDQLLKVYVTGEVYRSDTYYLPNNYTIEMLFDVAGIKATSDVSLFDLNKLIENNATYHVPMKENIKDAMQGLIININKSSIVELMLLPGIGEVIALRIIEYRQHYPFKSISEIKNVKGIGDVLYEKIKDYITI